LRHPYLRVAGEADLAVDEVFGEEESETRKIGVSAQEVVDDWDRFGWCIVGSSRESSDLREKKLDLGVSGHFHLGSSQEQTRFASQLAGKRRHFEFTESTILANDRVPVDLSGLLVASPQLELEEQAVRLDALRPIDQNLVKESCCALELRLRAGVVAGALQLETSALKEDPRMITDQSICRVEGATRVIDHGPSHQHARFGKVGVGEGLLGPDVV